SEKRKRNIFDAGLETRELIEWACEISFWARAVLRPKAARHAARLQPNRKLICPSGLAHIVGWVERSETHHKPMMGFTEPAIGLRSARTRWFNPSYRQPRVALGSRV